MKLYAVIFAFILVLVSLTPIIAAQEETYIYVELITPEEGTLLTGGSKWNLTWSVNTTFDLSAVRLDLEYVYNGTGPYTIVEDLPGDKDNLTWNVPEIHSEEVFLIIKAEADDNRAWDMVQIGIDTTTPRLISFSPEPEGHLFSIDCIQLIFNERINEQDFLSNFTLYRDGTPLIGTYDFQFEDDQFIASFCPAGKLDRGDGYNFSLNGTVRDLSQPGNKLSKQLFVNFTVVEGPPSVTVYEPTGIVQTVVGDKLNITWSTGNFLLDDNPIHIRYTIDGGETWYSIREGISDVGKVQWTVPMMLNFNYPVTAVINVSAKSIDGYVGYAHSSFFVIQENIPPTVEVLRPYSGAYGVRNQIYRIRWKAEDHRPLPDNPILISVSTDNGLNWRVIAQNVNNGGQYDWEVDTVPGTVLVNVTVTDSHGVSSWAHSPPLTVLPANPLSMKLEENATFYYSRERVNITWESPELVEDVQYVRLNITYNAGSTWSTLTELEIDKKHVQITMPFQMSSRCMIRLEVVDDEGTLFYFDSHMFEIMPRLLDFSVEQSDDFTFVELGFEGWVQLTAIQRAFSLYKNGEEIEVSNRDILQVGSTTILYIGRDLPPGDYVVRFESEGISGQEFSTMELGRFSVEEETGYNYQYLFALIPIFIVSIHTIYYFKWNKRTP